MRRGRRLLAALALAIVLAAALLASQAERIRLGAEAYLYGYPLVLMDLSRAASAARLGPENQLQRARRFPGADFKTVVKPNVDTLYTSAFIDADAGPWVFEMAPNAERYALMPFMDAWTHVFATPGTRTSGSAAVRLLLAGPQWQGEVPAGLQLLRAPTRLVWLIGRTQTNGTDDYPTAHRLQDGLRLRTLADWRADRPEPAVDWTPAGDPPPPPVVQLHAMGVQDFFGRLAALMQANPPHAGDAAMLARLTRLGLAPGRAPRWNPLERSAIGLGRRLADWRVAQALNGTGPPPQGWRTPPAQVGDYGQDYAMRAAVARVGLGANLPADALYPGTRTDAQGRPLDGSRRYRLHFAPDRLPPVHAFWSITAYGLDDFFLETASGRHALGDRDALQFNADGSLDLWLQPEPPAPAQRANWLPVRAGQPFQLTARLYWPKPEALDGRWTMPAVEALP